MEPARSENKTSVIIIDMKKYFLEAAVFLCGTVLMIIEIVGSRILAPYFGVTIISWTVLIGVILSFLSLGYFIGGRLADYKSKPEILANIILLSALTVFIIIPINIPFLNLLTIKINHNNLSVILASLFLFGAPSFLLGMITPYATKLRIVTLKSSGKIVGNLYAVSTVGSIVGTFAAGFFLIPNLGITNILNLIVIILIIASFLVQLPKLFSKKMSLIILFIVACVALYFYQHKGYSGLVDVDTLYNRGWIYTEVDHSTKRLVRYLKTGPFGLQGGMFLDKDNDLVFKYQKYYRLGDFFNPNIKNALGIGGGTYSYPKDFLKNHSKAKLDVVEIDPGITELARKYFNLENDVRLTNIVEDGRIYLNNNQKQYDAIYIDAFNTNIIPYQLTTREAVQKIYNSLTSNGVVIVNIISAIEGDKSKLLRSEFKTYQTVFSVVYLFQVDNKSPNAVQNIILIGLKNNRKINLESGNAEFNGYLKTIVRKKIAVDLPILSDNYAPVDYYTTISF